MAGELRPGTRLIELRLAEEFQVSQGPVREALRELEAMDLVTTQPYKGSRMREVTAREIREAYAVRANLEEMAGRVAAAHLKGAVGQLQKEAAAIRKAARAGDIAGYTRHDMEFHRGIVEASDNRILLRTWDSLAFEIRMHRLLSAGKVDLVSAQEAHWLIVEALGDGEGARAGRLLREHVASFGEALKADS
jgi:DNA-binding GntR family transcriptional regulator